MNDLSATEEVTAIEKSEITKRDRAIFLLGGIRAVDRISKALDSQAMIAALAFQSEDLHEEFGYSRFADFLDKSKFAPMTKHEFYKRKEVYENEGEKLFDTLNGLDVPLTTRKLLGKGNIQLDGEKIIVIDPATKEETSFDAGDKSRILETITALADANADKSKKLEKGREDHDRLKRKLHETETQLESARLSPSAANTDEIETCYMVAASTLKRLNSLLDEATLVRVAEFEDRSLRVLAAQYQRLNEIIAAKLPGAVKPCAVLTDSEEDRLASLLDDE